LLATKVMALSSNIPGVSPGFGASRLPVTRLLMIYVICSLLYGS
jgi:hypothetical protein